MPPFAALLPVSSDSVILPFPGETPPFAREASVGETPHQSEERYRKLILLSPDANFVHVDGLITLVNQAFCRLMGATRPEQLLGRPAIGVAHASSQALVLLRQIQHFANQPVPPTEMTFVRLDGTTVEVEVTAVAVELLGHKEVQVIARDISARQAAVTALRESEERFKFVARAVSDVVWDWNIPANTLWWNDGFLTTFGFAAGEIEPSVESWTGRIHPDDRSRVVASMRQAITGRTETWKEEYRFQRKDGTHAIVQDSGYILRDATGQGVRMVGGMRDLTEHRKMEAQYLRAQRMESIGTLAGGIAHDLNNVLAPIMMSIELLKHDPQLDTRRSRILDIIQQSSQRGANLVRQVLVFARGGLDGQRVAVGLPGLLGELEGIVTSTFPRSVQIVVDLPAGLWPVLGDITQIHQVLLNLAVNARDAMPHGGTLTFTASNRTIDSQYASTSEEAKAGQYVLLRVTDTGVGMPQAVRERIFEPFFTTKERGKGTGIGLATVHTIVKSHGGFLSVESEPGRGTSFLIHLPAVPEAVNVSTNPFPRPEIARGHDELVLVVDDECSIREITQQTLETFGYRVITARDGAEAVALFAKQPHEVALVLADMMMPIMDGEALIHVLRHINPVVRIIAASGLEVAENIAKAAKAGVTDFLPKPYTADILLRRVRAALDHPLASSTTPHATEIPLTR
ncbi:MAG: PAS domain S-box protein [Verrucomicrobia bacterium]|nr:PAS domain S-box protein [Verrucomicrobiota bacterium]